MLRLTWALLAERGRSYPGHLSPENFEAEEVAGSKGMNRHKEEVYDNPWNRLGSFFFTAVLVLLLGIGIVGLLLVWVPPDVSVLHRLAFSALAVGFFWSIWGAFQGYLRTSGRITLDDLSIKGMNLYKRTRNIDYGDIASIRSDKKRHGVVFVADAQGREIEFNDYVNSFGHIVETVLDRAENVKVVDIDDLIENTRKDRKNEGWQKEVNYEIIDRAKARAEENRKKMDRIAT